jgi:CRP-like cAMP-binding protein
MLKTLRLSRQRNSPLFILWILALRNCILIAVIYREVKERSPRHKVKAMRYYSRIVKKYKKGEIIFSENSECDGMYIIDSGRARVFKTVGEGTAAKEIDLCTLGPKAMFGEMAMIDENKRSASVQAIESTACTVITKKLFEDQLSRIPTWMVNMIKILVLRLRETNEKLRTMVEQYAPPPDDTGGVLTIDEDSKPPSPPPAGPNQNTHEDKATAAKHYRSEQIVKELFDPKASLKKTEKEASV